MPLLTTGRGIAWFPALIIFLAVGGCSNPDKTISRTLETAKQAVDAGDVNLAVRQLNALSAKFPGRPDILEALGHAYAREPDYFSAALFLQQAADADPARLLLLRDAGEYFLQAGDTASARQALQRFLDVFPGDGEAWNRLAPILRDANETVPAVNAYLKSFSLTGRDPSPEEALSLGDLFFQLDNHPNAEAYYRMALLGDDLSALPALFGLLRLDLLRAQWTPVQAWIAQLDARFPGALDSSPLASARADLRAFQQAGEDFARAREAQSAVAQSAGDNLARATTTPPAAPVPAVSDTDILLADTPALPAAADPAGPPGGSSPSLTESASSPLSDSLPAPSKPDSSPADLASADGPGSAAPPASAPLLEASAPTPLADARQARLAGHTREAVSLLWDYLGRYPASADAWFELSLSALAAGDAPTAETAALETLRLAPQDPDRFLHYVEVIRVSRNPSIVLRELARGQQLFPNHPGLAYELARAYEEIARDTWNAVYHYRRFLRLDPEHPSAPAAREALRRLGAA